jgi:hypothetical protein
MRTDHVRNLLLWLGLSAVPACAAGSGPGAQPPERSTNQAQPAPPIEAELRASPPVPGAPPAGAGSAAAVPGTSPAPGAPAAGAAQPGAAASPAAASGAPAVPVAGGGASPASAPEECVQPPDPELDKESAWSQELGQRLERELATLERCSADLPADDDDEHALTLRLVYRKDGTAVSQHVVTSTPSACAASECIKQGLAGVRSPALLLDKASIDLRLALARDRAPERRTEPTDPLTPEALPENAEGCVDPEVARLSRTTVREIVATAHDELTRCYGEALQRDHAATGKVNFEFVIGQDGAVAEAWARQATLPDCEAIRCMLGQFRALRFPEPVGRSVRVIYPINYLLEQSPVTLR